MIFGIGTDIIEVSRMEKHLEKNDALMRKLYTDQQLKNIYNVVHDEYFIKRNIFQNINSEDQKMFEDFILQTLDHKIVKF